MTALAIAASHSDALTRSCLVVERLTTVDDHPDDEPLWTATLVSRSADHWVLGDCDAGELDCDASELVKLARRAELVVVGGFGAELADRLAAVVPAARVVAVDDDLTRVHGWRWAGRASSSEASWPAPPVAPRRTAGRWVAAGVAGGVLVLGGLGVAARWPRPAMASTPTVERIGPVAVQVPASWRRTELAGDRVDDGRGVRAVFAAPDDGRRLVAVVTGLRDGATQASVAQSLANRLTQRGDDVVVEFAPASSYGGREVITYRELPASGPAVRWYVAVLDGVQVSVGCQEGTGTESIDAPCRAAVESLAVP